MMHVHPHDALADPLPFVMQDASPRPLGLLRSGFRETFAASLEPQQPSGSSKDLEPGGSAAPQLGRAR